MELFSVIVKAEMYVLAENKIDAENIAAQLTGTASAEMPGSLVLNAYAYHIPNQSDDLKKRAINFVA
jgi:hypothetical protein